MKTKRTNKSSMTGRYVVENPATLKDFVRIYRMKNGVLKKAKELEKALCPAI